MPTLPAVSADALLVTPEELEAAALQSLALDVSGGAGTDDYDQTALALADAEERVSRHLDRALFVSAVTQRVRTGGWDALPPGDPRWDLDLGTSQFATVAVDAVEWPVVEITSPASLVAITDEDRSAGRRIVSNEDTYQTLVYFAGYRGRQHTLDGAASTTALTGLTGLASLTVLPPLIPADIRRAIQEIALIYLNQARQGTLGTGQRIQQTGQSSNVIESVDTGAEIRALSRVNHYRRIVA